jgi:hypothetical protein
MTRFASLDPPVELPGMMAMTPGSTMARALGGSGQRQQWFTIGAQYTRSDGLRVKIEDEFDSAPNDLIAPAAACHLPGVQPVDTLRLTGSDVHHHSYFSNAEVRDRLDSWLRR